MCQRNGILEKVLLKKKAEKTFNIFPSLIKKNVNFKFSIWDRQFFFFFFDNDVEHDNFKVHGHALVALCALSNLLPLLVRVAWDAWKKRSWLFFSCSWTKGFLEGKSPSG